MVNSITSKADSIQVVYDNYINNKYIVNRRYQRKLVWTQQEKVAFIDSIVKNYSIPLFLLAQNTDSNGLTQYEIIDGMQRLNSIVSFIENEFGIEYDGKICYFNVDTLASTLNLKQQGKLVPRNPQLPKDICLNIVSYQIPVSLIIADQQSIEEIFRRINSFGKQLSSQEIRQAGAIGAFSDMVRKVASTIRGDVSTSDILPLNSMRNISLSNTNLKYGINISDLWWVKQHIVTVSNIRVSRDEELIAWLLSYMILGKSISPSSKALNRLYRHDALDKENNNQADLVEMRIKALGADNLIKQFCTTFSLLLDVLHIAQKDFRTLIFTEDEAEGLVRTFQVVFLAIYELLHIEHMVVDDMAGFVKSLDGIGVTVLKGIVKEYWNAESRFKRIQAVKGVLRSSFRQGTGCDVAKDNWVIQIDNILRLSTIEGSQYDFKAGFRNLRDGKFNEGLVRKCVKLLTAAVNKESNTCGYIIVGVCESLKSFEEYKSFYNTGTGTKYQNTDFFITGIDEEVKRFYGGSFDKFQNEIINVIKKEPIEECVKHYILTNIKFPRYYDVTLMVLQLMSLDNPVTYDDKYYERQGNNAVEVKGISAIKALESRFNR